MTTSDQIKALAELAEINIRPVIDAPELLEWYDVVSGNWMDMAFLPSYLTSYDAIIPLIQKQDLQTMNQIVHELIGYGNVTTVYTSSQIAVDVLAATPSQLCEALLRATGK